MSRPLQNRVAPTGAIEASPARGLFMGNRGGRFHDDRKRLTSARWMSKAWIICRLAWKGRHREVMGTGYTELFFLDEATALAAGHRPCFLCRRAAARAFADLFPGGPMRAPAIDTILHRARRGARPLVPMANAAVPGAMILNGGRSWLVTDRGLRMWSPEGYGPATPLPDAMVTLLTPPATLECPRRGYAPVLHPTAGPARNGNSRDASARPGR